MTIKDILVHVDSTSGAIARLDLAVALADTHDAHLVGLHVKPNPAIPVTADYGSLPESYFEELQRVVDADAREARAKFEQAIRKTNISSEWRAVSGYPSDVVRRHARYADLVIVGQHNPDANGQCADLPNGVLLTTGRPTLIVPYAGSLKTFGTNVMIAWDDGAQATRAVHDALPIMLSAAKVTVIAVNPEDTGDHGAVPGADLCLHLARHGLNVEAHSVTTSDAEVADVLLGRAFDQGCDLFVMGAYGHSRWKELVLGGVTQHMLSSMTMPVLMSH